MVAKLVASRTLAAAARRPALFAAQNIAASQAGRRGLASQESPDDKAAAIINKVPSSSLWTKTGGIILGTGLTAAAISSELYVSHEC